MERWIIGECNSEGDGVSLYQFAGTAEQVKNEIVRMVISGKDEEDYEYGSEEIRQISTQPDGSLYGYANYSAYHIDYTAKKLSDIEEIRPDDSLQEYNDSERKEVITRLVVNHMEDEKNAADDERKRVTGSLPVLWRGDVIHVY